MGKLGAPNYEGSGMKRNFWKITDKEGDNIYSILPPFGSLAVKGKWFAYYAIHYGYVGTETDRNGDPKQKPFLCIQQKNKDGLITTRCPACEKRGQIEAQVKRLQAQGVAKEVLTPLFEQLRRYNLDKKYYLNVRKLSGEVGELKIPFSAHRDLKMKFEKLRKEENLDPIRDGVFFSFTRTGFGLSTEYSVDVFREMTSLGGQMVPLTKRSPITEELIKRLESDNSPMIDLGEKFRAFTPEQIGMIVNGTPTDVDRAFGLPERKENNNLGAGATPSPSPSVPAPSTQPEPATQVAAPATTPVAPAVSPLPTPTPQAPVEVAPPTPTGPAVTAPKGPISEVGNMSEADLLALYKGQGLIK